VKCSRLRTRVITNVGFVIMLCLCVFKFLNCIFFLKFVTGYVPDTNKWWPCYFAYKNCRNRWSFDKAIANIKVRFLPRMIEQASWRQESPIVKSLLTATTYNNVTWLNLRRTVLDQNQFFDRYRVRRRVLAVMHQLQHTVIQAFLPNLYHCVD